MSKQLWDMIRFGGSSTALRQMRDAYDSQPNASNGMRLGVSYLYTGNFDAAAEHYRNVNEHDPTPTAMFYGMAGVAKWCLNVPEKAVAEWRNGLRCEFADWAGGVKLPLLMYFASAARPEAFPKLQAEAETLLTTRANNTLIENWPGPLAEFVLGRIDETSLRSKCRQDDEVDTSLNHWLADFYVGLTARASGDDVRWADTVRRLSDTSRPEWSNHDFFLAAIWNEEFFLARHEASVLLS